MLRENYSLDSQCHARNNVRAVMHRRHALIIKRATKTGQRRGQTRALSQISAGFRVKTNKKEHGEEVSPRWNFSYFTTVQESSRVRASQHSRPGTRNEGHFNRGWYSLSSTCTCSRLITKLIPFRDTFHANPAETRMTVSRIDRWARCRCGEKLKVEQCSTRFCPIYMPAAVCRTRDVYTR